MLTCWLIPLVFGGSWTSQTTGRVDIGGGRHIYLRAAGKGKPTVVLVAGLRNTGDIWSVQADDGKKRTMVFQGVAAFTRVVAYDRPGTTLGADQFSRSDPVRQPRTVKDCVTELHSLLVKANIPGPYVMVGHSTGGLIVRLYASMYPKEVGGMVLVDAIPETMQTMLSRGEWEKYNRLITERPSQLSKYRDLETIDFTASFAQMRKAKLIQKMPLIVLLRDKPSEIGGNSSVDFEISVEKAWSGGQKRLAKLVPGSRQITKTQSGHYIQLEQPQIVIKAIREVVDAVRTPTSWERKN